jgi:signal recognition particle subunit SEC65
MRVSNPYYEGVRVKGSAVRAVKDMVREGFYQADSDTQWEMLKVLGVRICSDYGVEAPKLNRSRSEHYSPSDRSIGLPKTSSIISYLHELRHHLQHTLDKRYPGHNQEEDARAWSLRVFKVACPKSFKKSAFNDKIMHITWEGDNIVNSRGY